MWVDWQPDEKNVYLTSGSDNLALHQSDAVPVGGRLDHFGFLVSTPEEVDGWALRLAASGVELAEMPRSHRDGSRSLYFCDPDGNLIQILFHPHIVGR